MRFGLVQGLCRVPGFEAHVDRPGLTASAGPVLAVDRRKFLAIGGYDELYFPGPDRGPRPRLPGLDGRLARALRARVGRLSPRLRLVRPGVRRGRLRPAGPAEHPAVRLEEPRRPSAASGTSAWLPARVARGARDRPDRSFFAALGEALGAARRGPGGPRLAMADAAIGRPGRRRSSASSDGRARSAQSTRPGKSGIIADSTHRTRQIRRTEAPDARRPSAGPRPHDRRPAPGAPTARSPSSPLLGRPVLAHLVELAAGLGRRAGRRPCAGRGA